MNKFLEREPIVQEIKNILSNYEENCKNIQFKKGIYIYGSPGCGKTHFITEILNELNYDIIKYDAGDIRNKALIDTITSNSIGSQNVLHMMKKTPKKIAIIMDEIDGMNNGDKGGITSLIKLIRQKKTKKQKLEHQTLNPIICIGNYYVDKKIKELMKVCHIFELKQITRTQITSIINDQMPLLNICQKNVLEKEVDLYEKMLEYIQGDLRKLAFIKKIYDKDPNIEESLFSFFYLKTFNEDSKKITNRLLTTDLSFQQHSKIINDTDRTIVALLWHENIVDILSRLSNHHSIPFYLEILDNICFSDYIDRITFQNQIWQFNEMSSLIKTFYNNHLYHKNFGNSNMKCDEIRFTKVLTKYSTEYNNILFIYNLCQELHMDKKDLIALFQELRLFFGSQFYQKNERLSEIESIFENYNISKLDIKRIYRYLDKNVKKDVSITEEDESDIEE